MLFTNHKKLWNKRARWIATSFILIFLSEIAFPTISLALTGGPSQPEFQSFQQIGDQDMVDLFSGDFKYNIPLFEIGGYPINLNYQAGIGMEQEASWVGLGWNLTPGMISRNVRGLPDDFNGEKITEKYNMKKEIDIAVDAGLILELIGKEVDTDGNGSNDNSSEGSSTEEDTTGVLQKLKKKLKPSFGITFNFNSNRGFSIGGNLGLSIQDIKSGSASAGLDYSPSNGMNLVPTIGYSHEFTNEDGVTMGTASGSIGIGYNSRNGLQNLSVSYSTSLKEKPEDQNFKRMMPLSATIPINEYSYFPYSKPIVQQLSSSFNTKIGGDIIAIDGDVTAKGSYAETTIAEDTVEHDAYGYLYLQNGEDDDLSDFNRDGDASAYYPGQNNLMPTSMMPDVYAVTGHGMAGAIRPYRMETGPVSEPSFSHLSAYSADLGVELASGNTAKGGWDTKTFNKSLEGQPWQNATGTLAGFEGHPKNTLEQNIMFRHANEVAPTMDDYLSAIGDEEEVAFNLVGLNNVAGSPYPQRLQYDTSDAFQRIPRQQEITILTSVEASHAGLEKQIENHTIQGDTTSIKMGRSSGGRKDHHISEITCVDRGGARYVYGIPAMNKSQKEVMFNASGKSTTNDKVSYDSTNATLENELGKDHYFYSKELKPYAHSYLLTAWLGDDYIDIDNNGVTDNDYGQAVKFNWKRVHEDYGWRTPFGEKQAFHAKQSLLSSEDDRGSYSYGTKEIWYAHSIESKDQIAFFYTSTRSDGIGVSNELGAIGADSLHKLDSIRIFSKKAWNAQGELAEPLKVIEFKYGYTLCDGTPNAQSGKLTLERLYIRHGNSTEGNKSPYVFSYGYNPDYNPIRADRWGYYKGQNTKNLAYDIYPYVNEEVNQDSADVWASAWNLDEITIPSGARYTINYEADEYAWVQDKRAQQMYHIIGIGSNTIYSGSTKLYGSSVNSSLEYDHLFIENPDTNLTTQTQLDQLVEGLKDDLMYFKMRTNLLAANNVGGSYSNYNSEFIRGYAKVLDIGFCVGTTEKIYIKVEPVDYNEKGKEMNPFLKASLDFLYTGHQDLIFGGIHPNDNQVVKFIKNLITIKDDIISLILGPYGLMIQKGMAKSFDKTESLVRLNHSKGEKRGGGHRVKRIEISDRWSDLAGSSEEYTTVTGQEYSYDLPTGKTSGVAQYEPSKGNDENPFKYPEFYKIGSSTSKKPKPSVYQEGPFGESFFPPAGVGYSRVTVRDINAETAKTAGTYSVHQFHTAKDFPFVHMASDIEIEQDKEKPLWAFFGYGQTKRYTSTTQGYVFIFNDMHGKKKKETVKMRQVGYEEELIRSTEYVYQKGVGSDSTELINEVKCINRNGHYENHRIGIEAEVSVDTWESFDESTQETVQPNTSGFNVIVPGVVPPIWYTNSGELKEYRTIVTSKFIQKQGILKKIIETNRNFTTTLENEVWDSHTGEVLLTSHTTEYDHDNGRDDVQYAWKYPAHWTPKNGGMGHAYRNNMYIGDVDTTFVFLTAQAYDTLSEQKKLDLREMLYRGLLDGLDDSLYLALSGNIVQGGVFAEGDEVYVSSDQEVYYAEEVLTYDEVSAILAMTGAGGTPPLSTGGGSSIGPAGPGQDSTSSGGSGGSGIYEPCGSVVITDQTMWSCYQSMLDLANNNTINLSSMPLLDSNDQLINDYLSSPNWQEWYGLWHDTTYAPLYDIYKQMLNNSDIRSALIDIYTNAGKRKAYYNLFECPELLSCLMSNANNSSLINAFEALLDAPLRLNLVAAMANHYESHHVVTRVGLNSGNSWLEGSSAGCYDNNEQILGKKHRIYSFSVDDTCPRIADFGTYEFFFSSPQSYTSIQNYVDTSNTNCGYEFVENDPLGIGEDTNGVIYDCGNVLSYNILTFQQDCQSYFESASTAGGGVEPKEELDSLDQSYNLPLYDELVLFMNRSGDIVDLDGKEVKIIRSGRRNTISATAGETVALNQHPIDTVVNALNNGSVQEMLNASVTTWTEDWPSDFMPQNITDGRFNPYLYGQRGIYRPKAQFTTHGSRDYTTDKSRNDGVLKDYVSYWNFAADTNGDHWYNQLLESTGTAAEEYWLQTEEFQYYSGAGPPLQSVNALDIYSSLVAERNNHVIAKAVNSPHHNLLFEGFEMNGLDNGMKSTNQLLALYPAEYWLYSASNPMNLSNPNTVLCHDGAHTGYSSVMLRGSETISGDSLNQKPEKVRWKIPLELTGNTYDNTEYRIPGFMPDKSVSLILTAWMQSVNTLKENPTYVGTEFNPHASLGTINIQYHNGSGWYTIQSVTPSGSTIDGWQRLEKSFTIPGNADSLAIQVIGGQFGTLVDDIRIFPDASSTVSYVYTNPHDRLVAQLDENHYATFYKYDQDGRLIKLERETESGRLTVKESDQNTASSQQ